MANPAQPKPNLRILLDTNLLIAGTGWARFPYEVLQHAIKGDYTPILTASIIEDSRKYLALVAPDKIEVLEDFLAISNYEEVVDPSPEELAQNTRLVRDPKDIPVALAAINAKVDFLISQDKDLTAQDDSTQELRQKLKIVLPGTFLREYMSWTSEGLEAIRLRTWHDLK